MKLPISLPDELLLSRLIRYVTVSNDNGASIASRVFGSKKASIHPFLTARLEQLAEWSLESAEVMLFQQTLAPLFLFFLPTYADRLKQSMLTGDGAEAHRASQLSLFGCGNSLYLKWCPVCAQQDLRHYGVAYWHRIHQIPGVTACAYHPILLEKLELFRRQRIIAELLPPLIGQPRVAFDVEIQVARFCLKLLKLITDGIPRVDIALTYRSKLSELGFITAQHRVRRKSLLEAFCFDLKDYRPGSDTPFPRHPHDYRYLSQLLESHSSHHPFRHLLFSYWLFKDPQQTLSINVACTELLQPISLRSLAGGISTEQQCLQLLRQQYSLIEIYRLTGKSRCYLKRLALLNDIPLKLKPKKLTEECQKKIIGLAYTGMHRKAISEWCGVGIGSVEQVISSRPGLVKYRKLCHWESKRRRCRFEIAKYVRLHPRALRRDCKAQCNAAFSWLYLNDPVWLDTALPEQMKPVGRFR
ncbi:TnsD family Tn7-like transposition protein [Aeromonas caviae]|uniref:TnsD family Tn7-like transposition protein n=1 Tax=Aeromonas caviae TaxID=648 RepID=UPI0029D46DCA|nr:TnsD family Tn7-like transposition protein [Aeromonas caviae]MDX7681185.1 TnsD family Tn7-like transposition protein [Aeromonas caviae]MDX7699069.1 TnsD family Tn7-like transposition protein [Aeromonas caviae]MDX7810472.1 TnsD family Tn7-like transposition protein [Aeromonas caviae]